MLLLLGLSTAGCMKQTSNSLESSAETATSQIGCEQLQSKIFDSLYSYMEKEKEAPALTDLKLMMSTKIDQIAQDRNIKNTDAIKKYKAEFNKIFEILLSDAKSLKTILDSKTLIQTLIEMEMHDQSTVANIELNQKLSQQLNKVEALSATLDLNCRSDNPKDEASNAIASSNVRMVAGMSNVISTAYQSCQAIQIPAVTAVTPDVLGITHLAQHHPDGIGDKRIIGNLSLVQQTHPYIQVSGRIANSSCYNVYDHPLIYDYGGEPFVNNNSLNFFKDAGSGTSVLGMDCSSLVSSAVSAAGLRYRPGLDNKAIYIHQGSQKFINAARSGFTCFKNITLTPTETIKPGDIAAVNGHVLMVDSIGADPFGFKKLAGSSSCNNLDFRNFDFVIAQSSHVKNGIGIHKFVAKDYLPENLKMKSLFLDMATESCKAYFNGQSSTPKNSQWGIIRHKGSSECLAPKIKMAGQACVSSCQL